MKTVIFTALLTAMIFAVPGDSLAGRSHGPGGPAPGQNLEPLSEQEAATLVFMREEEKLARDTSLMLNEIWPAPVFVRISSSEQWHMNALARLLHRYGLEDPVTDGTPGVFQNESLLVFYTILVDQGLISRVDAYLVGALIEEVDIHDLEQAIAETTHKNTHRVYSSLLAGSENHLRAFVRQLELLGVDYTAQVLDQERVDEILYGL